MLAQARVRIATLCIAALGAMAPAAHAQLAGSLAVSTNEMFRGESISSGDPVVAANISLDSRSGLFAGASASLALDADVPRISALVQYLGYAARSGEITAEVGLIHRSYARIIDIDYHRGFFEGFVGVGFRGVRARFYASPDYKIGGGASYYAEINAPLLKVEKFRLEGHAGLSLIPYENAYYRSRLRRYRDWRLQISRPIGPLFIAVGVNGTNYPVYSETGRARAYASISRAF
ncbi:MAG: TorF family putative porin [Novosphingobium sp.]